MAPELRDSIELTPLLEVTPKAKTLIDKIDAVFGYDYLSLALINTWLKAYMAATTISHRRTWIFYSEGKKQRDLQRLYEETDATLGIQLRGVSKTNPRLVPHLRSLSKSIAEKTNLIFEAIAQPSEEHIREALQEPSEKINSLVRRLTSN